jgi:hypothetical protein
VPETVSRDELKMKIYRHDEFLLVETLPGDGLPSYAFARSAKLAN